MVRFIRSLANLINFPKWDQQFICSRNWNSLLCHAKYWYQFICERDSTFNSFRGFYFDIIYIHINIFWTQKWAEMKDQSCFFSVQNIKYHWTWKFRSPGTCTVQSLSLSHSLWNGQQWKLKCKFRLLLNDMSIQIRSLQNTIPNPKE